MRNSLTEQLKSGFRGSHGWSKVPLLASFPSSPVAFAYGVVTFVSLMEMVVAASAVVTFSRLIHVGAECVVVVIVSNIFQTKRKIKTKTFYTDFLFPTLTQN